MHKTRRGLELGADFLSQCGAIKTGHAHQIACPYVSLARRLCRPLQQVSQRVGFERHRSFSAVLASVKTYGVAYPKQITRLQMQYHFGTLPIVRLPLGYQIQQALWLASE